jgi:hypothetical protein
MFVVAMRRAVLLIAGVYIRPAGRVAVYLATNSVYSAPWPGSDLTESCFQVSSQYNGTVAYCNCSRSTRAHQICKETQKTKKEGLSC